MSFENFNTKLSNEEVLTLLRKKNFVDGLSYALANKCGSIIELSYEVYEKNNTDQPVVQEYLIVTYFGGTKTYRSLNCDSHSAILSEVAKLANGGYYQEIKDYEYISTHQDWFQII